MGLSKLEAGLPACLELDRLVGVSRKPLRVLVRDLSCRSLLAMNEGV